MGLHHRVDEHITYLTSMLTRQQLIQNIEAMEQQGASQSEVQEYINSQPRTQKTTPNSQPQAQPTQEKRSLKGFGRNVIRSGADLGKGVFQAVTNPVQTAKTVGRLGLGTVENIAEKAIEGTGFGQRALERKNEQRILAGRGGLQRNDKGRLQINPSRNNQISDEMGKFFKNRYGSRKAIGDTLYNDPVGIAADVAGVLSGGAGLARSGVAAGSKAITAANTARGIQSTGSLARNANRITKAANKVTNVANRIDPTVNLFSGAKKANSFLKKNSLTVPDAVKGAIGFTTNKGGDTFQQIFDAARGGRKGAIKQMRAGNDIQEVEIVRTLDTAVSDLNKIKAREFKKLDLKGKTENLNIAPLKNKLSEMLDQFNVSINKDGDLDFSRSRLGTATDQNIVKNIYNDVSGWGKRKGDLKPSGIDTLKQRIGNYYDPTSKANAFTESVRKQTRNLLKQVDGYDEYARNYGEVQELITQLKREMSQGNKNSSQTYRKLANAFKQRNTEVRRDVLRKLQDDGVSDIIDEIAGFTAKKFIPDDIFRNTLGIAAAMKQPFLAPLFSPRVMGEASNALGFGARQFDTAKSLTGKGLDKAGNAGELTRFLGKQFTTGRGLTRLERATKPTREGTGQ